MVLRSFTQRYIDTSTATHYSFVFFCDISEYQWASIPIPKNHGKHGIFSHFKGRRANAREHEQAFERANREAMLYFNRCTKCHRWVCDEKFIDEFVICAACNKEREENNEN